VHNSWYNFLSAKNVSLNLLFVHADFHNAHRLVHGSHMQQLGLALRTSLSGRLLWVDFSAKSAPPHKATIRDGASGALLKTVTHGSGGFTFENVAVTWREKRFGLIGSHGSVVTVNTGRWLIESASRAFPNPSKNAGKALLDVQIEPLYDADRDPVAPHGLVGQSWDGDALGVTGALDEYRGTEVTTRAMAEGAIEGEAAEYEMDGPFATDFKYSRFSAAQAKPRDASTLKGRKSAAKRGASRMAPFSFGVAGASPDVEDDVPTVTATPAEAAENVPLAQQVMAAVIAS